MAKTYFNQEEHFQVTFYGMFANPKNDISAAGFSQIDFCLVDKSNLAKVIDVWSDRRPCLQSRRFLLQVHTNFCFDPVPKVKRLRYCFSGTSNIACAQQKYCARFCEQVKGGVGNAFLTYHANKIAEAMHIPTAENYGMSKKLRKPWLSQEILELMELREEARKGNYICFCCWEILKGLTWSCAKAIHPKRNLGGGLCAITTPRRQSLQ